ncbi:hypothetical protein AMECASPLE_024854 [Ameca splendens]|uniref:Uncharacterized protein n=1 Tax=Ameca splendens TaxID=208324 RepID=A0ABV1AAT2_9TELE
MGRPGFPGDFGERGPPGPDGNPLTPVNTEEIRATDIQRPSRAQEPQDNHRRDYCNPPRDKQGRVPGEPPSSRIAEAPGRCSDKPTGPAGSRLHPWKSSNGPRDPRPWDISLTKQRPDRAQGPGPRPWPWQAATGTEPAHTKAPSPGYREPQVHRRVETPTTGRESWELLAHVESMALLETWGLVA